MIKFKSGAVEHLTANRVALKAMRKMRVFSPEGYVSLDFAQNEGLLVRRGEAWDEGIETIRSGDPRELAGREGFVTSELLDIQPLEFADEERPLQAELDSFLRSVREGTPPEVRAEDGWAALDLADRIASEIRQRSW